MIAGRRLRFGLSFSSEHESGDLGPFLDGFRELTGRVIEPVFCHDYQSLLETALSGALDAAWSPPVIAIHLEERGVARPLLAIGRLGVIAYHGALVVKRDSPVRRTRDLVGTRIAWVAPTSASGYLVPRLYLASRGLNPLSMFRAERFAGTHRGALELLLRDEVDAAAVYAHVEGRGQASYRLPHDPTELRMVATAGPIPSDLLVASTSLEPAERNVVSGALLALRDESLAPLQRAMAMTRFEPLPIGHLDPLRKLAAASRPPGPRRS